MPETCNSAVVVPAAIVVALTAAVAHRPARVCARVRSGMQSRIVAVTRSVSRSAKPCEREGLAISCESASQVSGSKGVGKYWCGDLRAACDAHAHVCAHARAHACTCKGLETESHTRRVANAAKRRHAWRVSGRRSLLQCKPSDRAQAATTRHVRPRRVRSV